MINFMEMTPQEAKEAYNHFIIHDMADLCISQGIEQTLDELINLINEKLDRLEP